MDLPVKKGINPSSCIISGELKKSLYINRPEGFRSTLHNLIKTFHNMPINHRVKYFAIKAKESI